MTGALQAFADQQGLLAEDTATQVADLICNLMHRCDLADQDPFAVVERAVGLYASERVAENDLGPDLMAVLTIDGVAPRRAIANAIQLEQTHRSGGEGLPFG